MNQLTKGVVLSLALSSISFSGIDLSQPAKENTNLFQTGQIGAINVIGTITSTIPAVKYVVFASKTGNFQDAEKELNLPVFFITQDKDKSGFLEPPTTKIYVKRVSDTDKVEDLTSKDFVEFKVTTESFITRDWKWFGPYSNYSGSLVAMGQMLTEEILKKAEAEGFTYDTYGNIKNSSGKIYMTPKVVRFFSVVNGICEVEDIVNTSFGSSNTMTEETEIAKIQDIFKTGIPVVPAFGIEVRVK